MRIGILLILTGNALRLHGALRLFGKDTPILTAGGHLRHPPNYAPVTRLKPVPCRSGQTTRRRSIKRVLLQTQPTSAGKQCVSSMHSKGRVLEKTIIWDRGKQRHRRNHAPCAVRTIDAPPMVHVMRFPTAVGVRRRMPLTTRSHDRRTRLLFVMSPKKQEFMLVRLAESQHSSLWAP